MLSALKVLAMGSGSHILIESDVDCSRVSENLKLFWKEKPISKKFRHERYSNNN